PAPAAGTNSTERSRGPQGPRVVSPEVSADRKVTFRIMAPKAESVKLGGTDIPGVGQGPDQVKNLVKNGEGVWEVTLESFPPGYYRYDFNVDGVTVIDPR